MLHNNQTPEGPALNDDILLNIFKRLNARDLMAAGQVNRDWNGVSNYSALWSKISGPTFISSDVDDHKLMAQLVACAPQFVMSGYDNQKNNDTVIETIKHLATELKCRPVDIVKYLSKIQHINRLPGYRVEELSELINALGFLRLLVEKLKLPFTNAAGMSCYLFAKGSGINLMGMALIMSGDNFPTFSNYFLDTNKDFYTTFTMVAMHMICHNSGWGADNPDQDFKNAMKAVKAFYDNNQDLNSDGELLSMISTDCNNDAKNRSEFGAFGTKSFDELLLKTIFDGCLPSECKNPLWELVKERSVTENIHVYEILAKIIHVADDKRRNNETMTEADVMSVLNSSEVKRLKN